MSHSQHNATWHVSRSTGGHGPETYRMVIRFDDQSKGRLTIEMDAQQFAEGLTARVTRVLVDEFVRDTP